MQEMLREKGGQGVGHALTSCLYTSIVWTSLAIRRSVGEEP